MGTVFCFDVVLDEQQSVEAGRAGLRRSCQLLHEIDSHLSLWNSDSDISRYRRGDRSVVGPELTEVLQMCSTARTISDGWFDAQALPGGIDPTGLVKGWAGDRALAVLSEAGCRNAMVNASGDVVTSGSADGTGNWRIGIQHPGSREHLMGVVAVDGAIATSGCYERGAHLYDPRRRCYGARFVSATVVGPSLWMADALATALAVAGPPGFRFIESLPGYEAIAMESDGTTRCSSAWEFAPLSNMNRPPGHQPRRTGH